MIGVKVVGKVIVGVIILLFGFKGCNWVFFWDFNLGE